MKILCFYPSLDLNVDAIAEVPLAISRRGHDVLIIGSHSVNSLKGKYKLPRHEQHGSLRFYRPFSSYHEMRHPSRQILNQIRADVRDFQPDLIFCSGEFNLRLAKVGQAASLSPQRDEMNQNRGELPIPHNSSKGIQKSLPPSRIPIVLLMEYLSADRIIYPRLKGYNLLRTLKAHWFFRMLRSIYLRRIACAINALIYVEYQPDSSVLNFFKSRGIPARYIPWSSKSRQITVAKEPNTGIYIGSLEEFKNAREFLFTLPIILEKTQTARFTIIGPGPFADDIRRLQKQYPGRLVYRESVPREEAETLIAKSCYGYTPVRAGGLGFIADCWAHRTALIATDSLNGYLNSGIDCVVAEKPERIAEAVNALLGDSQLREGLEQNGYRRYRENNDPEKIADQYLKVFESALCKR